MNERSAAMDALHTLQREMYARAPDHLRARLDLKKSLGTDMKIQSLFVEHLVAKWQSGESPGVMGEWVSRKSPAELAAFKQKLAAALAAQDEAGDLGQLLPYQNPSSYRLMADLAAKVEAAAQDLGCAIPMRPTFGTIVHPSPNGRAIPVDSDTECLIVLHDDLFMFAYLLSKAVISAFPANLTDDERIGFSSLDWREELNRKPIIAERFKQAIICAVCSPGGTGDAPSYLVEDSHMQLATLLARGVELFVVAHEYGHIIRGHLSCGKRASCMIDDLNQEVIEQNYLQEIEADCWGLSLTIRARQMEGLDLALSYIGADFFFTCAEILENGLAIFRTGQEAVFLSDSHPPPDMRRAALRTVLRNQVGDHANGPIELAERLAEVAKALWEIARPGVLAAREGADVLGPMMMERFDSNEGLTRSTVEMLCQEIRGAAGQEKKVAEEVRAWIAKRPSITTPRGTEKRSLRVTETSPGSLGRARSQSVRSSVPADRDPRRSGGERDERQVGSFCDLQNMSPDIAKPRIEANMLGKQQRGDPRVQRILDSQGLKYEFSGNAFKLLFGLDNNRRQFVFIGSSTEEFATIEIREVWSLAVLQKGAPPPQLMLYLLADNAAVKFGSWRVIRTEESGTAIAFAAHIAADCDAATLVSVLQLVMQKADKLEAMLSDTDML